MLPRGWLNFLFGNRGERLAAKTLQAKGYRILARNCRSRWGEIDLIARDGDTIVFVEVKTRSQDDRGRPEEAVTITKQRQISRAASAWLQLHKLNHHRCRFDVISIVWRTGEAPLIDHYQSAFEATN
jgi:putative endonuclease